jgi:histidinol phosphatase-like enzyme
VNRNAYRLTEWLDAVAAGDPLNDIKPNPSKAFEMFQSVIEYHVPKLARQEVVGDPNNPIKVEIQVEAENLLSAILKNTELKKQVAENE